jgi:hypothetical protein
MARSVIFMASPPLTGSVRHARGRRRHPNVVFSILVYFVAMRRLFPPLLLLLALCATPAFADIHVEHGDPTFTLDMPETFRVEPPAPGLVCHLREARPPEGAQPIAISIERLGGLLPKQPITREEAAATLQRVAPGARVSVERGIWSGIDVDVVETRIGEAPSAGAMVMYSARLPLHAEAIQLNVGGPATREPAVRSALASALAGLRARAWFAEDEARRTRLAIAAAIGVVAAFAAIVLFVRRRQG